MAASGARVAKPSKMSEAMARLSTGLGAMRLAPSVSALRVLTHKKPNAQGEKQFVRDVLPRLTFANPRIPVHVSFIQPPPPTQPQAEGDAGAETSSSAARVETPSTENSSVTIEFSHGLPPRKIQLSSSSQASKPASLIVREISELANFQADAVQSSTTPSRAHTAGASTGRKSSEKAPELASTHLAGSAEGLSEGVGQEVNER
ncbi:unnamed protein product [Jaminaea pallidilutea]